MGNRGFAKPSVGLMWFLAWDSSFWEKRDPRITYRSRGKPKLLHVVPYPEGPCIQAFGTCGFGAIEMVV